MRKPCSLWIVVSVLVALLLCAAGGQETTGVPGAAVAVPQTGVAATTIPGTAAAQATVIEVIDLGPESGVGPGTPDPGPLAPVLLPGSVPVTPGDVGTAPQPQLPRRTRHRRTGPGGAGVMALTSPITTVTCKLDALGNVADIVITKQDGSATQASCSTTSVLPGGRNVVLDFTDSLVVQVQQGKLTPAADGPVSWLMFRTDTADPRTCGLNVRPSSAQAVLTNWQAAVGSRTALSDLTFSCAASQLQALTTATFSATLPALTPLAPVVPTSCTRPFTQPQPNVTADENTACRTWVTFNPNAARPTAGATCPPTSPPKQWSNNITRQQLPTVRPADWTYRALSTATTSVKKTSRLALLGGDPSYITATVRHAPIPGVTSAMVSWWFNGNIDGDMTLGSNVYPRYLVWHPRDHISQDTSITGPTPGSAKGAYWSIIEFVGAPIGYTKASTAWDNNYKAFATPNVLELNANTLELGVVVDGNTPFRLRHIWADTASGLAMNSSLFLGIQPPYDSYAVASYMNPVAFQMFGGNCAVGGANAWVKHTVEEMGNFPNFLPQLYQAQTAG